MKLFLTIIFFLITHILALQKGKHQNRLSNNPVQGWPLSYKNYYSQ